MKLTKKQTERVVAGSIGSIASTAVLLLSVMLIWQVATEFERVTNHHIALGFFFAVGLCILQAAALLGYAKGMIPDQLKDSGGRGLLFFTCVITSLCSFVSFTRELDQFTLDWFTALVICLAVPYVQFNTGPIAAWWSKLAGKEWHKLLVQNKAKVEKLKSKPVVVSPTTEALTAAAQPEVEDTVVVKTSALQFAGDNASNENRVFTYGEGGPKKISLFREGDRALILEVHGWSSNQVSKLIRQRFETALKSRVNWQNPSSLGDTTYRWKGVVKTGHKVKGVVQSLRSATQEILEESD